VCVSERRNGGSCFYVVGSDHHEESLSGLDTVFMCSANAISHGTAAWAYIQVPMIEMAVYALVLGCS
jgi:hypothetical protein